MPYAGGRWVIWERDAIEGNPVLGGLPLREVPEGQLLRVSEAQRAVGWWLVGSARAMLALARQHALDRVQFGKPVASFQAIRHRLAETLAAIEGAEATLSVPSAGSPDLTAMLAKAAAGKAAMTAAKHCQQVLGGVGFTAEHDLHRHIKRVMVLDGLLGNARELTRRVGGGLRARGSAPRLVSSSDFGAVVPAQRAQPRRNCYRGNPSTRCAMMLRWISEVPPAMVPEKLRR